MTSEEYRDAIGFGVLAFVALPLLPDREFGPFGVINPHRICLAVVAFAAISWFGYLAIRAVGPRRGAAVAGFAGGFVSATATTATMARRCREGEALPVMVSAALLASVATFVQLVGVLAVVDAGLAWRLLPACIIGVVALVGLGLFGPRLFGPRLFGPRLRGAGSGPVEGEPVHRSGNGHPFSFRAALLFAAVLTIASLVGEWAAQLVGDGAAVLVAGLTGLADAHAGALAAASMSVAGDLPSATTTLAIGAAVLGNMVVKVIVSFVVGGRMFGTRFAVAVVPATAVFVLCAALSG